MRTLVKGRNEAEMNENYGIHLASLTALPGSVVEKARELVTRISSTTHRVPPRDRLLCFIPFLIPVHCCRKVILSCFEGLMIVV